MRTWILSPLSPSVPSSPSPSQSCPTDRGSWWVGVRPALQGRGWLHSCEGKGESWASLALRAAGSQGVPEPRGWGSGGETEARSQGQTPELTPRLPRLRRHSGSGLLGITPAVPSSCATSSLHPLNEDSRLLQLLGISIGGETEAEPPGQSLFHAPRPQPRCASGRGAQRSPRCRRTALGRRGCPGTGPSPSGCAAPRSRSLAGRVQDETPALQRARPRRQLRAGGAGWCWGCRTVRLVPLCLRQRGQRGRSDGRRRRHFVQIHATVPLCPAGRGRLLNSRPPPAPTHDPAAPIQPCCRCPVPGTYAWLAQPRLPAPSQAMRKHDFCLGKPCSSSRSETRSRT